jgi:hypothetical protein
MRKNLSFAFAAAALGLVMVAWAKASIIASNEDVARPKVELASPAAHPNMPFQTLRPVF